MTFTLEFAWWWITVVLVVAAFGFAAMTRSEGSYFPMPSWHLGAALLLLFAAVVYTLTMLASRWLA
ncbi:MAG: hypothetical protein IT364_16660 [Candidatus Hydrogenedentes bacterium]|nr:hypothetical protein [Candidatus Hydrogenedentota bacterium]